MGRLFQPFLFLLACSAEHQLRRQIEFLKAENEMLRKRVPKQRIFLKRDERERLIKLGKAIRPGVAKLITIVHPRTYQRWIQSRNVGNPSKKMGRPKTLKPVREIARVVVVTVRVGVDSRLRYVSHGYQLSLIWMTIGSVRHRRNSCLRIALARALIFVPYGPATTYAESQSITLGSATIRVASN